MGNRYDLIDTSNLPETTNPSVMGWYELGLETYTDPETEEELQRETLMPTEDEEINPNKYYYGFCPNERIVVKDSDTTTEQDYYIERIFHKSKLIQYNYERNPLAGLAAYEGDADLSADKMIYDDTTQEWRTIEEPKKEYPQWPEWNIETESSESAPIALD